MQNWIKVEENTFPIHVDILIWEENKGMMLVASYDNMQQCWRDNWSDKYEGVPTHWMPLPKPPVYEQ